MKNIQPTISVLVITFNHEKYIRQCLNSIVTQILDDSFEIIIVDDSSNDNTVAIIKEMFLSKYKNITLVEREKNIGPMPNVFDGYKRCKGEFIAVCEGDDYWLSQYKLQIQLNAIKNYAESKIVFSPSLADIDFLSSSYLLNYYGDKEILFKIDDVIINRGAFMQTASIMFERSILDLLPPWLINMSGGDYVTKVVASYSGALYVPQILSVYRMNSIGSWSQKMKNDISYLVKSLQEIWKVSYLLENYLIEDLNLINKYAFFRVRISYLAQISRNKNLGLSEKIAIFLEFGKNSNDKFSLLKNKFIAIIALISPILNRILNTKFRTINLIKRIKFAIKQ